MISLAVAVLVALAGCTKSDPIPQPADPNSTTSNPQSSADPWKDAVNQLRRDTDPAVCKTALARLNLDLASRPGFEKPAELDPEALKKLTAIVPFSEQDRNEIQPAAFSPLDGPYLAECFYLRDAVRSLEVEGQPPARQAEQAFAWVCRQVYRNPWAWQLDQGRFAAATLPPSAVLPRGYGSGLERAYVFLALLQQLGLDGCLIGPPDAGDKPAGFSPPGPDGKPMPGYPRGPFWAVGARVGKDILLFDPWRGEPFPNAEGKGVGTLAQIKTNPEQLKSWLDDKNAPWPLTADGVKSAAVYLAVPVSSLSRRMKLLEAKLQPEAGVRLAFDPAVLRERFQKEASVNVAFWNPVRDRFAYGRTLAFNLPAAEGGWDETPAGPEQVWSVAKFAQIPLPDFRRVPELVRAQDGLVNRLNNIIVGTYDSIFLSRPTARERIQRGQFQEAARSLVERQDLFQRGIELARSDRSGLKPWIEKMNALYLAFETARLNRDAAGEAETRAAIEQHWRGSGTTGQLLVDAMMADIGVAEATYLLAACKHEVAERTQARLESALPAAIPPLQTEALSAWAVARDAWASYEFRGEIQAGFPGRAEHVKTLAERAKSFSEPTRK